MADFLDLEKASDLPLEIPVGLMVWLGGQSQWLRGAQLEVKCDWRRQKDGFCRSNYLLEPDGLVLDFTWQQNSLDLHKCNTFVGWKKCALNDLSCPHLGYFAWTSLKPFVVSTLVACYYTVSWDFDVGLSPKRLLTMMLCHNFDCTYYSGKQSKLSFVTSLHC